MTGAIIDLNVVQGTRRLFERVNWTVSHRNIEVRDFVVRRLNYWMEQTQIACDIAYDDAIFLQEQRNHIQLSFFIEIYILFSSGEKQTKKAPPLSAANFGHRYRTRSLTRLYSIFDIFIKIT